MQGQKPRRSYIRRKRCLAECVKLIQSTLRQIVTSLHAPLSDQMITDMARKYAQEVEAHCWSPRLQITDEAYQQLTLAKAKELCSVLIAKQLLPTGPVASPVIAPVTVPVFQGFTEFVPPVDPLEIVQRQEVPFSHGVAENEDEDDFPMFWSQTRQTADQANAAAFPFFR